MKQHRSDRVETALREKQAVEHAKISSEYNDNIAAMGKAIPALGPAIEVTGTISAFACAAAPAVICSEAREPLAVEYAKISSESNDNIAAMGKAISALGPAVEVAGTVSAFACAAAPAVICSEAWKPDTKPQCAPNAYFSATSACNGKKWKTSLTRTFPNWGFRASWRRV